MKQFKKRMTIATLILSVAFCVGLKAQSNNLLAIYTGDDKPRFIYQKNSLSSKLSEMSFLVSDTCKPKYCTHFSNQDFLQLYGVGELILNKLGGNLAADSCLVPSCSPFANTDLKQIYNVWKRIQNIITSGGGASWPLAGTTYTAPATGKISVVPSIDGMSIISDSTANGFNIGWNSTNPVSTATMSSNTYYGAPFGYPQAYTTLKSSVGQSQMLFRDNAIQFNTKLTGGSLTLMTIGAGSASGFSIGSGVSGFQGVLYNGDYSTNYVARSLVDKGYTDGNFLPLTNSVTINGVSKPLSTNPSFTVSGGTTTTVTPTQLAYGEASTGTLTSSSNLTYSASLGLGVVGTNTTINTYAENITNSAANPLFMARNNGFLGFHTDSISELATDVNDAFPSRFYYKTNTNYDTAGAAIFKFGNKNTSGNAATRIFLGDMRKSNYLSISVFPTTYTLSGIAPKSVFIGGGSAINHFMIYNDGGGATTPNTYGNIELGTKASEYGTGLTGLVVSGQISYQNFVGMGTLAPTYDLHIKKTTAAATGVIQVIENNTATGYSGIRLYNDIGASSTGHLNMFMFGSSYSNTAGAMNSANTGVVYSGSSAGLNLGASNATGLIKFYVGGASAANVMANLTTTGLSVGNTSVTSTYKLDVASGDLGIATLGNGIRIKTVSTSTTSSTQTAGKSTLVGGTITITNANVTANSLIFITDTKAGSLTNVGTLTVVAGSGSFVVTSTNVLDVSTFNYFIIQPY